MALICMLICLLLMSETVRPSNALFIGKSKKKKNTLIAAKDNAQMPENVRHLLEEIGDNIVHKIQLGRTPVKAFLLTILNILSSGKFSNKKLELGYDEIYHNYLLVSVQSEKSPEILHHMLAESAAQVVGLLVYKLEKAQRVRLVEPAFPTEFADLFNIPLTPNKTLTLNRMITTASNIDKHFYTYDAANNNMCQTFVENIVDINGLTPNIVDHATRIALKPQDAKALVETLGSRKDIVKTITDLGGRVDRWVNDRILGWKEPLKKEYTLFGDMHVIETDSTAQNHSGALEVHTDNTVAVNGMADIVLQNTDDVFKAAVALESNESKAKKPRMGVILIGILLAILVLLLAGVLVLRWQKQKGKLGERKSTNVIGNKIQRDSSFTEDADASET